jgi:hypothetical protein
MSSFETVLDQFRRKRVLVVGDIMLDWFVCEGDRVGLVDLLPDSSTALIIDQLKADAANAVSGLAEVK